MFACKYCDKIYSLKSSLTRHIKNVHANNVDKKKFQCSGDDFQKTFKNKQSLSRHERFIHNIQSIQSNRSNYNCPYCEYGSISREATLTHLKQAHFLDLRPQFSSEHEFLEWHNKIETSTHTMFVATGGKHKDRFTKSQTLYCHRGNRIFIPKGGHKKETKLQGSCKLNVFCPAHIKYTVST